LSIFELEQIAEIIFLKNVCLEGSSPSFICSTLSLMTCHWLSLETWSPMIDSPIASFIDSLLMSPIGDHLVLSRFSFTVSSLVGQNPVLASDWMMGFQRSCVFRVSSVCYRVSYLLHLFSRIGYFCRPMM